MLTCSQLALTRDPPLAKCSPAAMDIDTEPEGRDSLCARTKACASLCFTCAAATRYPGKVCQGTCSASLAHQQHRTELWQRTLALASDIWASSEGAGCSPVAIVSPLTKRRVYLVKSEGRTVNAACRGVVRQSYQGPIRSA